MAEDGVGLGVFYGGKGGVEERSRDIVALSVSEDE